MFIQLSTSRKLMTNRSKKGTAKNAPRKIRPGVSMTQENRLRLYFPADSAPGVRFVLAIRAPPHSIGIRSPGSQDAYKIPPGSGKTGNEGSEESADSSPPPGRTPAMRTALPAYTTDSMRSSTTPAAPSGGSGD